MRSLTFSSHAAVWAVLFGLSTVAAAQRRPLVDQTGACGQVEVKPNLVLGERTTISGRITNPAGVPLRDSQVELRRFVSGTRESPAQTVQTDGAGKFSFELAEPGPYRLIASPTRAYAQPAFLNCKGKHCTLKIQLVTSEKDAPDSLCPVR